VAASYGQYNTHGAHKQLKLLQGLANLLRHQISAIHNQRATHWLKQVTDKYEYCSSHAKDLWEGEWLPWLQINWIRRGSGYERFTLGL